MQIYTGNYATRQTCGLQNNNSLSKSTYNTSLANKKDAFKLSNQGKISFGESKINSEEKNITRIIIHEGQDLLDNKKLQDFISYGYEFKQIPCEFTNDGRILESEIKFSRDNAEKVNIGKLQVNETLTIEGRKPQKRNKNGEVNIDLIKVPGTCTLKGKNIYFKEIDANHVVINGIENKKGNDSVKINSKESVLIDFVKDDIFNTEEDTVFNAEEINAGYDIRGSFSAKKATAGKDMLICENSNVDYACAGNNMFLGDTDPKRLGNVKVKKAEAINLLVRKSASVEEGITANSILIEQNGKINGTISKRNHDGNPVIIFVDTENPKESIGDIKFAEGTSGVIYVKQGSNLNEIKNAKIEEMPIDALKAKIRRYKLDLN